MTDLEAARKEAKVKATLNEHHRTGLETIAKERDRLREQVEELNGFIDSEFCNCSTPEGKHDYTCDREELLRLFREQALARRREELGWGDNDLYSPIRIRLISPRRRVKVSAPATPKKEGPP